MTIFLFNFIFFNFYEKSIKSFDIKVFQIARENFLDIEKKTQIVRENFFDVEKKIFIVREQFASINTFNLKYVLSIFLFYFTIDELSQIHFDVYRSYALFVNNQINILKSISNTYEIFANHEKLSHKNNSFKFIVFDNFIILRIARVSIVSQSFFSNIVRILISTIIVSRSYLFLYTLFSNIFNFDSSD